jgi:hypothetical protein
MEKPFEDYQPVKSFLASTLPDALKDEAVVLASDYSQLMDAFRSLKRSHDSLALRVSGSESILKNATAIIDSNGRLNSDDFWSYPHPLLLKIERMAKGLRPEHDEIKYDSEIEYLCASTMFEIQNFDTDHTPRQLRGALERVAPAIRLIPSDERVQTPEMKVLKVLSSDIREFVEDMSPHTDYAELKQVLKRSILPKNGGKNMGIPDNLSSWIASC